MAKQLHHLPNIRDFLINGFDDLDLRRLCYDVPDFRPVYDKLAQGTGKVEIVDKLIEYAEKTLRLDTLLALAKERNPARYKKHGPYYRKDATSALQKQVSRQPTAKTILILAANPKDTSRLRLDEEVREIDNGLQRAQRRDAFILKQVWAARPIDIRRAMLDLNPNIVHFCGHGGGEQGIAFEDEIGDTKLVSADALMGFFELFADKVECVVLNACYSETQAEAIAQHINRVVGMKRSIGDTAAIEFAVAFYDALGAGESIDFAYRLACNAIQWGGLSEHSTPILKSKHLPINNRLLAVLELYKEACQKRNIPFYTPYLFLALLDIRNGIAQRALDQLRPGLAKELRERLVEYTLEILPKHADQPFSGFDWMEREDIKQAQRWASELGAKDIMERHLVLGMLDTGSNTMTSLREQLGEEDFQSLKRIVESMPDIEPTSAFITPGPPTF